LFVEENTVFWKLTSKKKIFTNTNRLFNEDAFKMATVRREYEDDHLQAIQGIDDDLSRRPDMFTDDGCRQLGEALSAIRKARIAAEKHLLHLAYDDFRKRKASQRLLAELAHATADDRATAEMLQTEALSRAVQQAEENERRLQELTALLARRSSEQQRRMELLHNRQEEARAAIDADNEIVAKLGKEIEKIEERQSALSMRM